MHHRKAADVRDALNELDTVEGPGDEGGKYAFDFALVYQPGYSNGDPHYEVHLVPRAGRESVHIPRDVLDFVNERDLYLRVDLDDGTVHVRDW